METTLHVLNGDSTFYGFRQTGLDGDTLVWREVLSEGPLEENIASGSFWRQRMGWICQRIGESPENYQQKVIDPLVKLSEPYQEINLWFEFDLHCQVNLLGVINYINRLTDLSSPAIYLICPEDYPGIENFRGMGQLNAEQLENVFDNNRVQLGEPDFMIAAEAWEVYLKNDAAEFEKWISDNNYWGNMRALKPALQAHLKRLKLNSAGLNGVEQKLLNIYKSGITTKPAIYEAFWRTEKIYGMGDLEIDIYLKKLAVKGLIDI